MKLSILPGLVPAITLAAAVAHASPVTTAQMSERYAAADRVSAQATRTLVLNETVVAHWLVGPTAAKAAFWYVHQRADGNEYRLVTRDGAITPAFDHARLAHAVASVTAGVVEPGGLAVTDIVPGTEVFLAQGKTNLRCTLHDYLCETVPASRARDPRGLPSPDGKHLLVAHDGNLFVRDVATGSESALSTDGVPYFAWGKLPDSVFLTLVNQVSPLPIPPWGTSWSPNGRFVIATRSDERAVQPYPFLESAPRDGSFRPIVRTSRIQLLGEPAPAVEIAIFDTVTRKRIAVSFPTGEAPTNPIDVFGWSPDGNRAYAALGGSAPRRLMLVELDLATGQTRPITTEHPAGFVGTNASLYSKANVRVVAGGRQIIWYSARSGWGHLYRFDLASGRLLNAVTKGKWLVRDILAVDEARQRLIFTATGREPSEDPYRRRVYRVNFDGTGMTLLTPEDADHSLDGAPIPLISLFFGTPAPPPPVSPDATLLVDTYSTIDKPPVTVMRRISDGKLLTTLETADARALLAAGWRAPEAVKVKAADGTTDLYGVIYWPGADAGDKVPLIDSLYGGPQEMIAPHNFPAAHGGRGAASFAALGMAALVIDGRATPGRSQAFQDAGVLNFGDIATDDHAAVVRALTARYARLDATHVGVTGHSFGGYVSVRAMLRYPAVFQVGVSSAGPNSYEAMYDLAPFLVAPDYGNGQSLRPSANARPANYAAIDNITIADRLRGHLLLGIGDLDENALPAATIQFIDALIKAGKPYDLVYLPNQTHRYDAYFGLRRRDYFTRYLLGVEPPAPPYGTKQ